MYCTTCKEKNTCKSLCSPLQSYLDKENPTIYLAYWYERVMSADLLEFILYNKDYAGRHSLLDSITTTYSEENIKFIKYLIKNHLSEKQKNTLIDYYFNRLNQYELAKKYNVKQPTIHFHLKKGISRLKQLTKELL
jgi:RNA polymerase sigma factor (sigma-70 family)